LEQIAGKAADPHYGAGIDRGDDMFEVGGFIVRFFDRALIAASRAGSISWISQSTRRAESHAASSR
jgi:hypothetical protein